MNTPPTKTTGHWLIWVSVLALTIFILWANWATLDQITRANGHIISSSRNQIIQAADGGVLLELPVREGQQVKQGDLLVRFDATRSQAGVMEIRAKVAALRATQARLNAEILGEQPKFPAELTQYPEFRAVQMALFNKRQAAVRDEVASLEQSAQLVKEELELNLPLLKSGDVSRVEVLKLQRQVADIQGQITNRRNKYLQEIQTDMAKAQEELSSAQQILTQREEQLHYTAIHAPMDGIVRSIRLTTLGGVARAGEEIMQIVPLHDDKIIEAKVKPADIAFVRPGLPASIKLDAYDYTIYGALPGEVSYISADTLNEENRNNDQPHYRLQIKILHIPNKIQIQPGMTATVEIKTGSNTVFGYLSKPVTKTLQESMGER